MASLQTQESIPGGLRFLTLQHAHNVARERLILQLAAKDALLSAAGEAVHDGGSTLVGTKGPESNTNEEEWLKSGLKPLHDGYQKLYSYFPPRLDGGKQTITATQTIVANGATEKQGRKLGPKITPKPFTVEAPQFSLPEGSVHSLNPAPGGLTPAETLPHVVFTDPHLPWERRIQSDDTTRRSRMPWLALLVFSPEELQLPTAVLQGDQSPFAATSLAKDSDGKPKKIKQSPDLALSLSWADVKALNSHGSIISPIPEPDDATAKTNAIFIQPNLFNSLVTTYEEKKISGSDGKTTLTASPKEGQTAPDISRFVHFAHVRHVKTAGMAASAQYKEGLFSVILSHRAGPLSNDHKSPAIAHLVSLEGWQDMKYPLPASAKYVALSTLYSWSYSALPTASINLEAQFENLKNNIGVLRAPQSTIDEMKAVKDQKLALRLSKRIEQGYTMQRHRTRTGELTSSFFRGALTPVASLEPTWSSMSHCGSDLQILDRDTGMMDITYSAAWQLGKSLALADGAFTTALSRLWNGTQAFCLDGSKRVKLTQYEAYKSRGSVLESLKKSMGTLNAIQSGLHPPDVSTLAVGTTEVRRDLSKRSVLMAVDDVEIRDGSEEQAKRFIRRLAGTLDEKGDEYPEGKKLYNELNACVSTDWKIILGWIMDRMYLFRIPPHYLIADPTFLPRESLRFFQIDPNWLDALVDGALSLGCHMERDDDYIRRTIKGAINTYVATTDSSTGYRPQIPTHGVLIRTQLVSLFPDLKVEAPIPDHDPEAGRASILRQEIIGDGLLLCLFDRVPGKKDEMPVFSLTQPPHQQTFALGDSLNSDSLHIRYKRTYTVQKDQYEFAGAMPERVTARKLESSGNPLETGPPIFLWGENGGARFILADIWAKDVVSMLREKMPGDFTDNSLTSAVAGFQLGMPIYRFCIGDTSQLKSLQPDPDAVPRLRAFQLLEPLQSRQGGSQLEVPKKDWSPVLNLLSLPRVESGPPPHFNRIPEPTRIGAATTAAIKNVSMSSLSLMSDHDAATGPTFDYSVRAIGERSAGQLRSGKGPLDLIFGIVRSDDKFLRKDYWIKKIELTLPRGAMKDSPSTANLFQNYDGPGPTMLSNLRFNVLAATTGDSFRLRLQPRSRRAMKKGVLIDRVSECGFILPLVNIHTFDRLITVDYTEEWAKPPHMVNKSFTISLKPSSTIKVPSASPRA